MYYIVIHEGVRMFKNLSIKTKLVLLSAITLFGLAMSVSLISINKSTDVMIKYEMNKLLAVETAKHGEIERYFSNLEALITSIAASKRTEDAFDNFEASFYKLEKDIDLNIEDIKEELKTDFEANYISNVNYNVPSSDQKKPISSYLPEDKNALIAQYIFITDNSAPLEKKNLLSYNPKYKSSYMDVHKEYHPYFSSYNTSFHLHDIYLVDLRGNIIYTSFKEKDFATNLINGVYKDSGLSRAYKKATHLNKGEVAFEDFTPHEPCYNVPSSFISTPIYIDGKMKGVIIFEMPSDDIDSIMQFEGMIENSGLGDSGEAYLVGPDYMMRSNSRFLEKNDNKIVQSLGTTIGVLKVQTKSTAAAISGKKETGQWTIDNYRGTRALSAFDTVHVFDTKWVIVVEIDEKEVLKPALELQKTLLITSVILLLIFSLITLFLIHYLIGKPLHNFQNGLLQFFDFLLGKKDDLQVLVAQSNDEIGEMVVAINRGIYKTKENFKYKENESWISKGISRLNELLVDAQTVEKATSISINFISEYLNVGVGVLYVFDEENNELKEYAGYAHLKKDGLSDRYSLGQGVVGQVALQKSPILLSGIDVQNTLIQTAIVSKVATNTYTLPLLYNGTLYGVIEVGSFKSFEKRELDFLNASNKVVATSIFTSIQNTKVKDLLKQTNIINQELNINQQKLEEANARMEEQQLELETNNAELEERQQQLEMANSNMEEQQQQLEEANANMEEQQQQLQLSGEQLKTKNDLLENIKKELEARANDLELSGKYKSEFLANMSHELRTPLNAIILLSQLLEKNKKNNLSADDIKKANTIFNSGHELLKLINDILDLSKVESGNMELIIDKFDSSEFLNSIENLFEHGAKDKGLELKIIDEYKNIIFSDRDRISQIIRNLISNALKFTSNGSITIKIADSGDINRPIEISITDTGIGIPLNKQKQIFEAFKQADGSTSRMYGGTGLGLSISKELTRLLGGEISLISEDGEGSKFIVKIPNLDNCEDEQVSEQVMQITQKIEPSSEAVIHKTEINDDRKILGSNSALLVIDDDVTFAEIVYENIKRHNHFGLIAHTAKDGLKLIREHNISGIMLDLGLPDMDGIEVLKELKNDYKLKDIPVYIISSKDRDDSTLKMGAIGYEQKPLMEQDIDMVISKLENFIKNKSTDIAVNKQANTSNYIDLSHLTILVVDDDIKNIFILDSAFGEYNAKVITAYNGKDAIEILKNDKTIDIVLMDIMMPIMNGYEAIEAIRADSELSNIPIIAVTANAMKEDRSKCMSIGADDFISKPINMDALISLVKVWSDKKHR